MHQHHRPQNKRDQLARRAEFVHAAEVVPVYSQLGGCDHYRGGEEPAKEHPRQGVLGHGAAEKRVNKIDTWHRRLVFKILSNSPVLVSLRFSGVYLAAARYCMLVAEIEIEAVLSALPSFFSGIEEVTLGNEFVDDNENQAAVERDVDVSHNIILQLEGVEEEAVLGASRLLVVHKDPAGPEPQPEAGHGQEEISLDNIELGTGDYKCVDRGIWRVRQAGVDPPEILGDKRVEEAEAEQQCDVDIDRRIGRIRCLSDHGDEGSDSKSEQRRSNGDDIGLDAEKRRQGSRYPLEIKPKPDP